MTFSYQEIKEKFESHLIKYPLDGEPPLLYEAANYIMAIGGKRIRPVLVLMAYNLFNDHVDNALNAALAVEVLHNFTLVHDDILDQATLRRTHATVHEKYGMDRAILSGDLMLIHVYKLLENYLGHPHFPEIYSGMNKIGIQICEGQDYDMLFEDRNDVNIDEYIKMISFKTAVLLGYSLQAGALLGGANKKDSEHLYQFGLNLGLAFQLKDDLLDVFGDEQKVGKRKGGDILQNKKTYLYLKAIELADEKQRAQLIKLYSVKTESEDKVESVIRIFRDLHVAEYSSQLQEAYQLLAFSHLDAINKGNRAEPLKNLCDLLLNRKS